MAEPVLKFPPEQKARQEPAAPREARGRAAPPAVRRMRRYRRFLLLVVLPLVAVIGGIVFYLNGGRYVGTDDTYVGAQKVLITPDISGQIDKVVVKEGQLVHKATCCSRSIRSRSGSLWTAPRPPSNRPRRATAISAPTSRFTTRWPS